MTATALAPAPATARTGEVTLRAALRDEIAAWDPIARRFAGHRVTHTRAWVESLRESGCGTPLYLLFERDGAIVGCLAGLVVQVAGWRLFGSPLEGWQTSSMGPLFDPERLDTATMMSLLVPYLRGTHGVHHIEMLHPALDESAMRAHGFRGDRVPTYRAALDPDEARAFAALKPGARQNIRRGERLGLAVRFGVDEAFIAEHFDQVREAYRRSGVDAPFSRHRFAAGIRALDAARRLIAVSVFLPGTSVRIATGSFLVEGEELLLWMWAHRTHYRWYRATELMTWRTMQVAIARGCRTFDLMGRGEFKTKFGAALDESKHRWIHSTSPLLVVGRPLARSFFRARQAVRGRVLRAAGRMAGIARTSREAPDAAPAPCVIGDIDLVRSLGLRGIRSTVIAPPDDAARFSRHVRSVLPWSDPWDEPDALVRTLLRHAEREPEPPVLFYQDDASLLLVSRHREALARGFRFVVADAPLVESLVDKARFQQLARTLDLPVPPAVALDPAAGPFPDDFALDGPFVLKPLTRRPSRWSPLAGDRKALLVESPEVLRCLWPRLQAAGLKLLAQSLVPGPETGIESYHVYVGTDGRRIAEFTGRKLRTYPASFGDSSALEISSAPELCELGRDLTARLGLTGVAKFDFKRRPDGRFALLEVNPRFTLWHHPAALAGLNIPAMVHDDLTGRERRTTAPSARAGVRWCKVWTDHAAARDTGIPFHRWLAWAVRCEAKRAIAWSDPLPLLGAGVRSWLARSAS